MPTRLRRSRSRLLPGNDAGLSVAEMVVAIWVTVIVLISAGAAFVKMGEAQRSAEAADRGTQLVQDKLETIHKRPYAQVGCYTNDPLVAGVSVCPAAPGTAPLTSPVNSSNGERIVNLGTDRPTELGPAPAAVEEIFIGDNKYTVTTRVTWADLRDPSRSGALLLVPESGDYKSKRVTVTASWTLGGKTRSVTRQWLRSPTSTEQFPPAAGAGLIRPSCAYPSPVCSINITDGQVLQNVTGFPASRSIEFTVQMSVDTTGATIKHGTITKTLTDAAGGGITNSGRTLTYVIPENGLTGTGVGGVVPGANTVTISVNTIYGPATATKVVNWRFPPSTLSPYQLANLHGISDSSRDVSTDLPPTGSEPDRPWFCVKLTDNTLWRYTAVIVDETNVDEMDGGYTPPKLYASGMDPAGPTPLEHDGVADLTQHPSTPVGGYVGTQLFSNGSLNTIRWSYGFQPGTKFPGPATGGTSSNIVISGERPGDGAVANASLTMPVYAVPYATDCATANLYVPLKADLSGTATGQTNNLSWTAPFGADSYKLYRVGTPDTLVYSGTNLAAADSGRPWGSTNFYYVVAYKGAVAGNLSDTLTLTTGPGPSALSGTATAQTNTLSWTAATAADLYKLYRVGTPNVLIYSGTSLNAPDSGRPWGSTSSYFVVPYLGAIVGSASNTYAQTTGPGPSVLSGTAISSTNTLTWTAATGADLYNLYRVGTPNVLIRSVTNLTATDPVARSPWGTATSYYVVPYKGAIVGFASNTFTLTTGPGPSVLSGTASGQTNNLSWTAVTGADLYTLYRGGVAITSGPALLTFADSARPWGLASFYHVTTSKSGIVGANSNTHTLTTIPAAPTAPTTTTDGIYFTVWCPTTAGAVGSHIYRYDYEVGGGPWPAGYPIVAGPVAVGTGWPDPTVITHTTSRVYYCTSVNAGGESAWSLGVAASGFDIVPAAPTGLYLSSSWGLPHTYAWSATPGATQYWLADQWGAPAVTVAGTTGTLTLLTNTTYSVKVYAYSAYGRWSTASVAVVTTTPRSQLALGESLVEALVGGFQSRRASSLVSADGTRIALLQTDGNFVIYTNAQVYVRQTASGVAAEQGMYLVYQPSDGNLVLYRSVPAPTLWQRQTGGTLPSDRVTLQGDGNLVVYSGGTAKWSAGTVGQTFFR